MQSLFPTDTDSGSPAWEKIKKILREIISGDEFKKWISPIIAKESGNNELLLFVPNMSFYQTVLEKYLKQIEYAKESQNIELSLRFEIDDSASNSHQDSGILDNEILPPMNTADQPDYNKPSTHVVSRALNLQSQLNPEYTFRTFVNGPSNQFAHASCLAVADAPGQFYNPLFLYGSTGLGKTHLLHAVGNKVIKSNPNAVITYITSERFMNEMIYCLRFNKMWDFRKKYRNCDVLLVDDIQFISGKERTQEEFFHTFNALYEAKKQIIVTSDIFPQDIADIEERLRNRFQWGLIADIQQPDIEHRVAILMNKAEKQGVSLGHDVAQYIARHAKGNVRVLEGALRRVIAFASLQGREIDIGLASEILQDLLSEPTQSLNIDSIQKIVADHFGIKIADLKSKKRSRAFSIPRQIAMYLSRGRTESSFPEIGEAFGGKDHTTVMHAVKKIEKEKQKDVDIKANIEAIERKLDQMG